MIDAAYEKVLAFWREARTDSAADLDAVLSAQHISFAYHSGRIENPNITYADTREIFERGRVTAYTGDVMTLFEICNAKAAYELFLRAYDERRPITEEFVRELHLLLTQNTYDERRTRRGERPGEYRRGDYVVGPTEVGAPAEDVRDEMNELLAELDDVDDRDALTAAAYMHAKFENIHPFADGNGRVGRLMMNYLLVLHRHPPITIHEEDRAAYYAALAAWDERQQLAPLKEFLISQTVKTWRRRCAC